VLEAGQVAADDDEVHPLGVLEVKVAHSAPVLAEDAEGEPKLGVGRRGAAGEVEREAVLADREAAHRIGAHVHGVFGGRGGWVMDAADGAAGQCGGAEDQGQDGGEGGELHRRRQARVAS
jgi:hypothetical protein